MSGADPDSALQVEHPAAPVASVDSEQPVKAELGDSEQRYAPGLAPAGSLRLHAVRVLVVDDNRDAADTLSTQLELLGHVAQVANDGRAALDAMQEFRPQVVFLDIGMPGVNGYDVAEAIRNDRRFDQPLLVALTGWGGEADRARTAAAGIDLHLTKPVDLAAIEQVLSDL